MCRSGIAESGKLYIFGSNNYGQFGNNNVSSDYSIHRVGTGLFGNVSLAGSSVFGIPA